MSGNTGDLRSTCGVAVALVALLAAASVWSAGRPAAQGPAAGPDRPLLDAVLDLYVRDGLVYYRALREERGRLDRYVASLGAARVVSAPREEQMAFWLNAYNALVLRTIIDRYPIPRRSTDYPAGSVRQIPGAFERLQHRVAGRLITLDQIETEVLGAFGDPRVHLALGRGAVGSGRLRSEAFMAADLERQLADVAAECLTRAQCVQVDPVADRVVASSIFSWREREFVGAYAAQAGPAFGERSPVERAVVSFIEPHLLRAEREFVARNTFEVRFLPFDWSLNDLTGR